MSNTTKKLTAGLLMAATTFTAGGTCFANQVGFFNDGTGCETARCYDELSHELYDSLMASSISERLKKEDDLMKKYYPEVFEKVDSAQKSIMECTDDNCIRENLEKIIDAEKQFRKEYRVYIDSLNDSTRSELAERGLANAAFWFKNFYSTQDILVKTLDKNCSNALVTEFYINFIKITRPNFYFIESEKAVYDYYKQTAAELGFDTSVSHEELIAQLKECKNDLECRHAKLAIELPTNNVLETQNFYCADPAVEPNAVAAAPYAELGCDTSFSREELIAQIKECPNDAKCYKAKKDIELPTNQYLASKQKPSFLSKLAPYAIGVVAVAILALPRILGRGQVPHANVD